MYRPHPRRARTNPTRPEAWGTSDRSGFIGNQKNLLWQYEWAGTQLINTRALVYADEYDRPQRQLGTIILPPDPVSILNARPEQYPVDEYWTFQMEGPGANIIQQEGSLTDIVFEYPQYYNTTYVGP